MRWRGQERSENVEDRRGMKGAGMAIGGVGGLILILVAAFFGIDPNQLANVPGVQQGGQQRELTEEEKRYKEFAEVVMKFTEDVWTEQFADIGKTYEPAKMVLFSDGVRTQGCGTAPSAVGPFYCPADKTVYLDPTFFNDLESKLGGSKAEFSQAYVIAHEVGHHVQNLLGYNQHVRQQQAGLPRDSAEYNEWSVRLELQADYLAGVWAHHKDKQEKIIEPGDIEAAITTAQSIGDDRIQKQSTGFVNPESFTHGSSAQRVKWFRLGLETGDTSKMELLFKTPFREL
jgi:predicted metalloprotease